MTKEKYPFEHELARRFAERGYETWITPEGVSVYVLLEKGNSRKMVQCFHYHNNPNDIGSAMKPQSFNGILGQVVTLIDEYKPDDRVRRFTLHLAHRPGNMARMVARLGIVFREG